MNNQQIFLASPMNSFERTGIPHIHGNGVPSAEPAPAAIVNGIGSISRLANTLMNSPQQVREDAETAEVRRYFDEYLQENVEASETMARMKPIINEFVSRAPRLCVWKCVDGRVHGSKAKGYPPGTITFARTEGANIDISFGNTALWNRIDGVVADAERTTPGTPALFIAFAHRSDHPGHGCAAHGLDDSKALNAVITQADRLRAQYGKGQNLYIVAGMTNTDDMSETLYFPDGQTLDSAEIIKELGLKHSSDVFSSSFLDNTVSDASTQRYVGTQKPRDMVEGFDAPMYKDLQTALAMEAFLLQQITSLHLSGGKHADELLNPKVYQAIADRLNAVPDLPKSLWGALMYQSMWNVSYALHLRNRMEEMPPELHERELDHAEELICYGEGFETLPRNKAILVKPGRGNDMDALTVAKKVLAKNRKNLEKKDGHQQHPPLVHINVEIAGMIDTWDAFKTQVMARLRTKERVIRAVFAGEDVRTLTTYSYAGQKRFYPVVAEISDQAMHYPTDVIESMGTGDFTPVGLGHRELSYAHEMLGKKKKQPLEK